jgi:hypothetical protein
MILATAQLGGAPLEILEVVRLHDLGHGPGLPRFVDLDPQLGHLCGESRLAGPDLPRHPD